jgi:hypothetical protein
MHANNDEETVASNAVRSYFECMHHVVCSIFLI